MEKELYIPEKNNETHGGVWKRFLRLVFKTKLPYIWIVLYIVTSMAMVRIGVFIPDYQAEIFNGNVGIEIITLFITFRLLSTFIGHMSDIVGGVTRAMIDRTMRERIWGKIIRLPMSFFNKNQPGELVSRITTDTERVSQFLINIVIGEFTTLYLFFETARQLNQYDWRLASSLLFFIPVLFILVYLSGRLHFKTSQVNQGRIADLTRWLTEFASNIPLVKSFVTEDKERTQGESTIHSLYQANISVGMVGLLFSPLFSLSSLLQTIVIVFIGIRALGNETITVTEWTAYFLYMNNLVNIINSKSSVWNEIKQVQGASNRISYLIEEKEEDFQKNSPVEMVEGEIVLEDLSFSFSDESDVLKNISTTFEKGKITTLVGLSGSGKTTLLNLVARFYHPKTGKISIGGIDNQQFDLRSYRESMAYVSQESGLYSGTIKENLLYGLNRNVSEDELIRACKDANAYEFIQMFEEGFNTEIGHLGEKLSGGQQQRVALARVILRQPKFLLLDEATANLDNQATQEVVHGLRNIMKNCTTIMVTHEREVMKYADQVIVLENGEITGKGRHNDLIDTNEYYKEIMHQMKWGGD